jgi:hypothetical protein
MHRTHLDRARPKYPINRARSFSILTHEISFWFQNCFQNGLMGMGPESRLGKTEGRRRGAAQGGGDARLEAARVSSRGTLQP